MPDLDAGVEQLSISDLTRDLNESFVGLGPRQQQLHPDAPLHRRDDPVAEIVVRHEVCGRRADPHPGQVDESTDRHRDGVPTGFGGAGDDLDVGVARCPGVSIRPTATTQTSAGVGRGRRNLPEGPVETLGVVGIEFDGCPGDEPARR